MTINLQMQMKNKKNYYEYLKENSYWFKELNRNPNSFNEFSDFVKEKYKLRVTDKVSSAIDSVEIISNVLDAIK